MVREGGIWNGDRGPVWPDLHGGDAMCAMQGFE